LEFPTTILGQDDPGQGTGHDLKGQQMKSLLILTLLFAVTAVQAQGVVKRQCFDTKSRHPVCKNIRMHKKVDGTPVPDAPTPRKK